LSSEKPNALTTSVAIEWHRDCLRESVERSPDYIRTTRRADDRFRFRPGAGARIEDASGAGCH
jgi:hypothetical protein